MQHKLDYSETANGITYTILNESRTDETVDFYFDVFLKGTTQFSHDFVSRLGFFADEPTTVSIGGYKSRHPAIIEQVKSVVKDGVSIVALNEKDEMVGFRLAHTISR